MLSIARFSTVVSGAPHPLMHEGISVKGISLAKTLRSSRLQRRFETLEPRRLLAADVVINEFMAANQQTITDGYGASSDWIELHNAGDEAVDLISFRLTDDAGQLTKWTFPTMQIVEPGEFLVVFASGRDQVDPAGHQHTNFKLSRSGEYLALVSPAGVVISEFGSAENDYPVQRSDISFGIGDLTRGTANDVPIAIPSNQTSRIRSQIEIENRTGTIKDISVDLKINHEWTDDLDAFLISPTGTRVELFSDVGGSGDHFTNTRLTDDAEQRIDEASAPFSGTFRPEESFRAFWGEPANGLWTLEINDDFSAVGGQLNEWSLILATTDGASTRQGYMPVATPGRPNQGALKGFALTPGVDVERGFFEQPVMVSATTNETASSLYFTFDGSTPSPDNPTAVLYTEPLDIRTTTTLRIRAYADEMIPSDIATHTYLFVHDVIQQPRRPEGFPSEWAGRTSIPADYEMDEAITNDDQYSSQLPTALRSLPSVSLVTDRSDWFDPEVGIYSNSEEKGSFWERPVSVELFGYENTNAYQIDAGVRLQGNASRWPNRPKHNLRLAFRSEYGASRLEFPLFGNDTISSFNSIVLRGGNGDSWINPTVQHRGSYIRDQWHRDAQTAMGHETSLQGYAHLYINGLYWGLYHLFERVDADFMSEHYGGSPDDYDVIKDIRNTGGRVEAVSGNTEAWLELVSRASQDLSDETNYAAVLQYIDEENLIDYMLINFYSGNRDWDRSNWRAGRLRDEGRFVFFAWDSERTDLNTTATVADGSVSRNVLSTNNLSYPTFIHQQLTANPEYRLRFADRAQRHLFLEGTLSPAGASGLWNSRADEIRKAIVAESARWGDAHITPPRNPETWESHLQDMQQKWFPARTDILLKQLRATGLYPQIESPLFNQTSGVVPSGFELQIEADENSTTYVTTDGSDPRAIGGEINELGTIAQLYSQPIRITDNTTIKARAFADGQWSALVEFHFATISAGDINIDGVLDLLDVELVCQGVQANRPEMDLNRDGQTNPTDLVFMIEDLFETEMGDANLDGAFDSGDLVHIFQQSQYEDLLIGNSGWASGDWNCDGEFDSGDLVMAFQSGGYSIAGLRR